MKKQKRSNSSGITLIALVISIIVMLILAGVSINAIVGENGVLTRTQYAIFINEMSAVEEAVQMWKAGEVIDAGGEDTKEIPANGLCKVNDLTETERLVGEVGFYRAWSISGSEPSANILSSAETFNNHFKSEMIFYPAGVQDLYYLKNEALGIKGNKSYLIDASTGMIYSMTGISLNDVRCYSKNMAMAVMNGNMTAPIFAEAEVSGTGSGIINAGNTEPEFLENGEPNPKYNPNGFRFISAINAQNIYKLYNNGDLYGKGIKNVSLNCKPEELQNISQYNWSKISISAELDKYKKIFLAREAIFMIDQNDEVYAYGSNANDKLGLNSEQKKEFTGREPIKLDVKDSSGNVLKVDSIYGDGDVTFLVTKDNTVYGVGYNTTNGSLGINSSENIISNFTLTQGLPNKKIKKIACSGVYGGNGTTVVLFEDGDIYEAGYSIWLQTKCLTFVKTVSKEDITNKFPNQKIKDIAIGSGTIMAILNNKDLIAISNKNMSKLEDFSNVQYIQKAYSSSWIIMDENKDVYLYGGLSNSDIERDLGFSNIELKDSSGSYKIYVKLNDYFTNDMKIDSDYVKEVRCTASSATGFCMVYIMNSGRVFASGQAIGAGVGFAYYNNMSNNRFMANCIIGDDKLNGISNLNGVKIDSFTSDKVFYTGDKFNNPLLISKDEDIYTTTSLNLMYGNDILESSWKKIASNVKDCWVNGKNIGYIDNENNGYVALENFEHFGVESLSEVTSSTCFRKIITTADGKNLERKVKEIAFDSGSSWVITTDNELYVGSVGKYDSSWVRSAYNGLGGEKLTKLTKVIDNVKYVATYFGGIIVVTDDKTYFTGAIYGQGTGLNKNSIGATVSGNSTYFENITNFNISDLEVSKIKKWKQRWEESAVLMEDGNMWFGGYRSKSGSLNFGKYGIIGYCSWESLGLDGPVVDFAECDGRYDSYIVLTDKGTLYGVGPRQYLGDGSGSNDIFSNFTKLEIPNEDNDSKIISIHGLSNSYVAVMSDGTVWGTGNNTYGILGRWMGIGRGESNSRYKNALNWVECPELEI